MISEIFQTVLFGTASGLCFGASVSHYAHAICSQRKSILPLVLKAPLLLFLYLAFRNGLQAIFWSLLFFAVGAFIFLSAVLLARKNRLR